MSENEERIPPLDDSNYLPWSISMESIMRDRGCWKALEGWEINEGGVSAEHEDLKRPRASIEVMAYQMIYASVIPTIRIELPVDLLARDIWRHLYKRYGTMSEYKECCMIAEIINITTENSTSLLEYKERKLAAISKYIYSGGKLTMATRCSMLIEGLGGQWDSLRRDLKGSGYVDILKEFNTEIAREKAERQSVIALRAPAASMVMHSGVCGFCKGTDHPFYQCPLKACKQCGCKDHTSNRCPRRACFICGKEGHVFKVCPNKHSSNYSP